MGSDNTLQLPKSAPVHSYLTESTKQLRIPHQQRSPYKRNQLPEFLTKQEAHSSPGPLRPSLITNTSSTSVQNDKKRLVDQFYDPYGTPKNSTPKNMTPYISRTNSGVEDMNAATTKFDFLKEHGLNVKHKVNEDTSKNAVMIEKHVEKLSKAIVDKVKHQIKSNDSSFKDNKSNFMDIKAQISDVKVQVEKEIRSLENIRDSTEKDFQEFNDEIMKLYKTLEILDQYERVVEHSRQELNENKTKLKNLTKLVEIAENMSVKEKEDIKNRNTWVMIISLGFIVLMVGLKIAY